MNPMATSGIIFVAVGLLIRFGVQFFEARQIAATLAYLGRSSEAPSEDARDVLLSRCHLALGAARLGRLLGLFFLVPGVLFLQPLVPPFMAPLAQDAVLLGAAVLVLFLMLGGFSRWHAERARLLLAKGRIPEWMTSGGAAPPPVIAAGGLLWNWLAESAERLTAGVGLVRPRGRIVEEDGKLRMVVGEEEIGAAAPDDAPSSRPVKGGRTEEEMIRAIGRLGHTLVREVMRPLNAVKGIEQSHLTAQSLLALGKKTGYTRIPIYRDQITHITHYVNLYDLLDRSDVPKDMSSLLKVPLFLPELARLDMALKEMLRTRSQIAICYDDYGGSCGLLTREDILEEITGEIMDEYDRPVDRLTESRGVWYADPTVDLDDLAEAIGLVLEKRHADTLAGYIHYTLGRTPRRGEVLLAQGWRIEILQMQEHRLRRLRLTPPPDAGSADNVRPAPSRQDSKPPPKD